jgi:hypothetical protein
MVQVFGGMVGAIVCGVLLDRYRRLLLTTIAFGLGSALSTSFFSLLLTFPDYFPQSLVLMYIVSTSVGFFYTGAKVLVLATCI